MPKVNHTVLLKFRPEVTDDQITQVFENLAKLKNSISDIVEFTGGPNNSPEGLADGFTHGFSMIFSDAAAVRLSVEHIDGVIEDVGDPWPTIFRPQHRID